ncbi:MAG: lipase family protein [Bacteroidetes bacterium]|nr:lipase family protein [Bacteroidota bacterium]
MCVALYGFSCHVFCLAQSSGLNPGFDKNEFRELLKVSSRQGDTLYNPDLPAPEKFKRIYRSAEMGLDNRWELWISENGIACISIRGTTKKLVSWLDNFYAAMVPASGSLNVDKGYSFNYHLSDDPKAAVHCGWLISTAFLSRDILPKIDSLYNTGIHSFLIIGHSQGGAISYLLTAHLNNLKKQKRLADNISFKTYSSAAPKPGNLYFAYAYENMTKGGWAFTVVNSADWVPEAPFSIQTTMDFNPSNPFTNALATISKAPFFKRILMRAYFNSLDKPTKKANREFQKRLGNNLEQFIRKTLPDYNPPKYFNSNNYTRTGTSIILYADESYYKLFPNDADKLWTHHAFEPYLYLIDRY